MSSFLKKSARKNQRITTDAACMIQVPNSTAPVLVRLNDISQGGMSFYFEREDMGTKRGLQIQFMNIRRQFITATGHITTITSASGGQYRYSVEFDKPLTEEILMVLLMAMPLVKKVA